MFESGQGASRDKGVHSVCAGETWLQSYVQLCTDLSVCNVCDALSINDNVTMLLCVLCQAGLLAKIMTVGATWVGALRQRQGLEARGSVR